MKKISPSLIGFLQALGVVIYCVLITGVLNILEKVFLAPPKFFGAVIILALLVFSAAATGSIIFGYPTYLALNKKTKEALSILAFTLLYCLAIMLIVVILIMVFGFGV